MIYTNCVNAVSHTFAALSDTFSRVNPPADTTVLDGIDYLTRTTQMTIGKYGVDGLNCNIDVIQLASADSVPTIEYFCKKVAEDEPTFQLFVLPAEAFAYGGLDNDLMQIVSCIVRRVQNSEKTHFKHVAYAASKADGGQVAVIVQLDDMLVAFKISQ